MEQQYTKFGTLEYRPSLKNEEPIFRHRGLFGQLFEHTSSWQTTDSVTGKVLKGWGCPVRDKNDLIVNFLKMSFKGSIGDDDSFIEDSLEPGCPIANCYVRFGKPTGVILITVDCLTAIALHIRTGHGTAAALYPDNLKAICIQLQERHTDSEFKICVNGDGLDEHNDSTLEAHEAARAIDAKVYASGESTFFELCRTMSPKEVKKLLEGKEARSPWILTRNEQSLKIAGVPNQWPNHFNGANLLSSLMLSAQCHVSMPDDIALVVGLWVMHTYGIDKVRFSPLLAILSPEYIEGTKMLLDLLHRVCHFSYKTSAINQNQLLKLVKKKKRPTLLFDDGDTLFQSHQIINTLKTSHDRNTGSITLSEGKGELSALNVFFAKATTSKAGLPKPISGLAIPIQLHRNAPNERLLELPPFDIETNDDFSALRAQMVRWWEVHATEVVNYRSFDLDLGNDQANDTYHSIFAIANAINPEVLQRAVDVVKNILAQENIKSDGVRLLENVHEILTGEDEMRRHENLRHKNPNYKMRIHSFDLAKLLCEREDWPWATCQKGRPLDQNMLATMLMPYGVNTRSVRDCGIEGLLDHGITKRGFFHSDFDNAFAQYVRCDKREVAGKEQELSPVIEQPLDEIDE